MQCRLILIDEGKEKNVDIKEKPIFYYIKMNTYRKYHKPAL